MIYLDHAATTPMSEEALEVYMKVARQYFGNSSSMHDEGSAAKQIIEASSKAISQTLNARAKDIFFTSGATEANFLAIYSLLNASEEGKKHLVTTPIEHSSVRNTFLKLEQDGYEVTHVPVNGYGEVEIEELKKLIRDDTALVSIQQVNSEIGIIQDIPGIGAFLRKKNVLFHSDCVQSYGRLELNAESLMVDALTISAHKIYGPKGIGAAWMNPKSNWQPVFPSTNEGRSFKPGTQDVPSIAAFATAAKKVTEVLETEQKRMNTFREKLISGLKELGYEMKIEHHPKQTIPNILGLRFFGMEGQFLMLECSQSGLAISTGSACQVGSEKPNQTMMALGKSEQEAREFVRLSFGRQNDVGQIPQIIEKMNSILKRHYDKVNHYRTKG